MGGSLFQANPDLLKFQGPHLHEATKNLIGMVFNLIDNDGDGEITPEDFAALGSHEAEAMAKWETLRMEFSTEDAITPRDFVVGIKQMAWKRPVPSEKFSAATVKNYAVFMGTLTTAINESIKKQLGDMLREMIIYSPEAIDRLREAWANADNDKSGEITVEDFTNRAGATEAQIAAGKAYFQSLQAHFDKDGNGSIDQAEFELGMKSLAIEKLDPALMSALGDKDKVAPGTRLTKFMEEANKIIVACAKEVAAICK